MAITAKISNNFVKTVVPFKNNYIMVGVQENGEFKTIYTRIADLAQIQSDGTSQYLEYETANIKNIRNSFENLIERFRKGEVKLVCRVAGEEKTVTDVPTPINYQGYFRVVPSYLVKDEAGVLFEEGKKDAEKPAEETEEEKKAKYILKQRAYKVVKNDYIELDDEYKYIAVRVKGEDKIRFVELSQIKYINENGELQQVGQDFRGLAFGLGRLSNETFTPKDKDGNLLKNSRPKDEYSIILEDDGQTLSLEEVYTDVTYKLEPAKISKYVKGKGAVELDAVGGIDLDTYRVRTLSVKKGTNPTGEDDEIVVQERPIDKFYVEQKTDVKELKPNQKAYVNYECYQLDETGDGDYLKIRYKGDAADTMVAFEYLFASKTDNESLKVKLAANKVKMVDLIGKPLYVKPKDEKLGLIETEPLTNEQAIFRYNERKFLYETTKDEDIANEGKGEATNNGEMSTGAYLLLKNGQFVKEADVVQPKCYDFCQNQATTVFDAYLVTIDETTDHPKTFIINKSYKGFNTSMPTTEIAIPGVGRVSVNKDKLKKVKRSTKGIKGCDIVQTTSKQGNDVENCAVLRKPKELSLGFELQPLEEAKLNEIIKQLYNEFMQNYKAKQYDIGGEVLIPQKQDDGSLKNDFIEFVQNRRYMYSSIVPMLDGATNALSQYLNMKANEFSFNADGSITGGPKYDAKKGVLAGYSKLGTAAMYALSFTFSGGGLLVSLASPFILLAAPAVIGAAGIVIPIVQGAKKSRVEQGKLEFPNKSEKQNESIKKDYFEKINELIEQVKDKYKQGKGLAENKKDFCLSSGDEEVFLSALSVIEQDIILGLTQNKNGGTFRKDAGKGVVNRGNAYEFGQYRKIVNELAKERKDLENKEKELTKELNHLKASGATQKEIEATEKKLNETIIAKNAKKEELDKAKENLIVSGTNNETDPELAEILNRIENAKLFIRAKYFRKMDGEWVKEDKNNKGIVDIVNLLDRTDIKEEEKSDIREALIGFVMHSDITVDVKGRKFDYINSHEKHADKDNVNWKKLKDIAAKYGLFADEKLGIETVDLDAKSKYLQVEKPIPTKVAEEEEEKKHGDVDEKRHDDEVDEELLDDAEAEKKTKNPPTQKGLVRLMNNFNIEEFKQYFKLIELEEVTVKNKKTKKDEKIKRKGLVYNEEAKRTILKYVKQYEKYKDLLHETIAELESKASLTAKQTEKLEKLREFRDNSEYLIKSFDRAYGSFSEADEEKSL